MIEEVALAQAFRTVNYLDAESAGFSTLLGLYINALILFKAGVAWHPREFE